MNQLNRIFFSLMFLILFSACKKNHDQQPQTPGEPGLPKGVSSKEVQIILPENSPVDLATCEVFSLSFSSPVDKDGNVKAAFNKGYPNIAYVFDKNKNVILSGFVTDSTNTISVGSTAEVLLYFGMGTTFQPYEIMGKFINGIGKVPGVAEWKTQVEGMFKNDPLMLQKGLFADALKTKVTAIIKTGVIQRKPADITVDANDIRSGLQLAENGLNSFTITNTFRRRSQAFIYKMKYKDLNGESHTVNYNVYGSITSISDLKISPTGAIRDFKGVMQDWAAGKGMEFAATANGPVEIPLEDNELEADFKVRVVGPGKPVLEALTSYEKERLFNISLQTLTFDYLLPVMLDAVGHKEVLEKINSKFAIGKDLESLEAFVKKTGDLIATIPAAADALEAGDYTKAFKEVLFGFANGKAGAATDEWIKILYKNVGDAVKGMGSDYFEEQPEFLEKRGEKLLKVLQVIDMGMKLVDYARITLDIAQSNMLEEWDLKAREVQINLDPATFSVAPLNQQKLTTYIKTSLGGDEPVIEYEWETTGKYGYLWDERGHKGNSFSSSIKEAWYLCNALESSLGQGEHKDTIKVTAYLKKGLERTKIGTNFSVATITKEDVFTVPLSYDVGIRAITNGSGKVTYNGSNPTGNAEFTQKKGARSYSIRLIKNGVKQSANLYYPNQQDSTFKYRFYFGNLRNTNCDETGLFLIDGMSEAKMLEEKARQEEIIECYKAKKVTGIEVTVGY